MENGAKALHVIAMSLPEHAFSGLSFLITLVNIGYWMPVCGALYVPVLSLTMRYDSLLKALPCYLLPEVQLPLTMHNSPTP